MEDPLLLPPLPTATTTTISSPPLSTIATRISSFLLLFSLALYANHEASKTFQITILSSPSKSLASRRFHLHFVSNGRASRAIHATSTHIQTILYPNTTLYPKKQVNHVTLQLSTHNLPEPVMVKPGSEPGHYDLSLSPSVVMEKDARAAVERALRWGIVRVWAWDGPVKVVDTLVEGLSGSELDPECWARLNMEMMRRVMWRDGDGEDWLSTGIMKRLCADYDSSTSARTGQVSWHVG